MRPLFPRAPLRNNRTVKLNHIRTRARAGIKGDFGDNSSEYELAGGTRSSERQKSGPRGQPATP